MKYSFILVFLVALVGLCTVRGYSQAAVLGDIKPELERARRVEADLERRRRQMSGLETSQRSMPGRSQRDGMSKEGRKEWEQLIREIRKVDPVDLEKFHEFLNNDKTGIFRLLPNFGCATKVLIKIDGECAGFVPEMSDFSFRAKGYTRPEYHDIGFVNRELVSDAFFSHGILVSLGNVPIETATLTHAGIQFLLEFQPASQPMAAHEKTLQLKKGIRQGEFTYASRVKPEIDTTYAIRTIAYKLGNSVRPPLRHSSAEHIKFWDLNYDSRSDTIVVFRIVRKEERGDLTIVWRELSKKKAPKIKFANGEVLTDFK